MTFSKEYMENWFAGKEQFGLDAELVSFRSKFDNDFSKFYREWNITELKGITEREGMIGLCSYVLSNQDTIDEEDEELDDILVG